MTAAVFVDTGILLACVDDLHPNRRDQARAWVAACWRRRCGRVSTQVLNDFYVGACDRFPGPGCAGDARAEVRRYQHWLPWAIDQPTIESAWAVESRYGLGYGDALVVASAQQQRCGWLLTENLEHGREFDAVCIVNPFTVGPELLDATP